MTKLALYDKNEGPADRFANEFFRHDFIYRKNIGTRLGVGIAGVIMVAFYWLRVIFIDTDDIFLIKELEQIKSYVELQKIRTDNTRFVNLSIKGELNEQKIAPMIFIPFVENAFKHCKNKSIENAISIDFEINTDTVKMTCKNYFDSNHLEIIKNSGLGIETMKQRLNLLYPKNHKLVIDKSEQWFSVTLSIRLLRHCEVVTERSRSKRSNPEKQKQS